MQVPNIKLSNIDNTINKVYVKFYINEDVDSDDAVKMVDLSKSKLEVVS
jgi:hypothetical protein